MEIQWKFDALVMHQAIARLQLVGAADVLTHLYSEPLDIIRAARELGIEA